MPDAGIVNVRYLVDDAAACIDYYTRHFGFTSASRVLRSPMSLEMFQPAAAA